MPGPLCQRSRHDVLDGKVIRLRGSKSGGFEDSENRDGAAEMTQSPAICADMLTMNGPDGQQASDLVEGTAKSPGGRGALEAPHGSVLSFDPAVVVFKPMAGREARPPPHSQGLAHSKFELGARRDRPRRGPAGQRKFRS
jgi:hypothetical protein